MPNYTSFRKTSTLLKVKIKWRSTNIVTFSIYAFHCNIIYIFTPSASFQYFSALPHCPVSSVSYIFLHCKLNAKGNDLDDLPAFSGVRPIFILTEVRPVFGALTYSAGRKFRTPHAFLLVQSQQNTKQILKKPLKT